ncbi:MAG: cysteine desulfurase [Eubacterium sp.]|nr:cysteine desulfurase [Eubacterium sp.]
MIYLDNAATTKPCEQAIDAAAAAARDSFGNVSSLHGMGIKSEKLMTSAQNTLLKRLGAKGDIYFTSGATESNNTVLFGVAEAYKRKGKTIISTAAEHPSAARALDKLEEMGYNIIRLSPKDAFDNFEQYVADAVTPDTILVSCMAVNNELGYITDTPKLYRLIKRSHPDVIFHTDGVQGFGKLPLAGDFISVSSHKIHGFKGIGALYAAKGVRFAPLIYGGGQQKNLRPGTEPVELIAAFEAAVNAYPTDLSHFDLLNAALKEHLGVLPGITINSPEKPRGISNIVNFSVEGVRSEIMLHFLEERMIYVSSGSACSKGKVSGVPDAFGISAKNADSAIRVSFSMENTAEDVAALAQALEDGIKRFRR